MAFPLSSHPAANAHNSYGSAQPMWAGEHGGVAPLPADGGSHSHGGSGMLIHESAPFVAGSSAMGGGGAFSTSVSPSSLAFYSGAADAIGGHVRRRRQSIEHRLEDPYDGAMVAEQLTASSGGLSSSSALASLPVGYAGATAACHITVLGDDAVSGKLQLVADYVRKVEGTSAAATTAANGGLRSSPAYLLEARVTRPSVGSPVVVLCPPCSSDDGGYTSARREVIRASQCVVLVFSVGSKASLDACVRRWAAEVHSVQAEVGHKIPIVLVGCDAERRLQSNNNTINDNKAKPSTSAVQHAESWAISAATSRNASVSPSPAAPVTGSVGGPFSLAADRQYDDGAVVPPEVAVKAAQSLKASKYVEVHKGNLGHALELFLQALKVSSPSNRPRTAAARLALCEALRCPIPIGRFDMLRHGVVITGTSCGEHGGGDAVGGRDGRRSAPHGVHVLEDQLILGTWDGTDPRTSPTAFVVRDDGFVPLPSTYFGAGPAPSDASLLLAMRARSLFPSEVAEVILPKQAPTPRAWFNTAAKTCVIVGAGGPSSAPSSGGGGGCTYRYTTDGTEPNEHSAVYSAPIHLDDSHAGGMGGGDSGGAAAGDGVATPYYIASAHLHSSHGALTAPPRVIRVRAYRHGGYYLPSAVADFHVPSVIEAPKVSYSAADGLLTISNAQTQLFEYRYTVDGSVPTASGGDSAATASCYTYTRPVVVSVDGGVRQLRVAAFPRQWLPSEEVVVDVKSLVRRDSTAHVIGATRASGMRSAAVHSQQADAARRNSHHYDPATSGSGHSAAGPLQSPRAIRGGARGVASPARGGASRGGSPVNGGRRAFNSSPLRSTAANGHFPPPPPHVAVQRTNGFLTPTRASKAKQIDTSLYKGHPHNYGAGGNSHSSSNTPTRLGGAAGRGVGRVAVPVDTVVLKGSSRSGSAARRVTTAANGMPTTPRGGAAKGGVVKGSVASTPLPSPVRGGGEQEGVSAAPSAAKPLPPSTAAKSAAPPTCRSEGNTVYFDFSVPIVLSHITITTPGRARGPDAYEVLVRSKEGTEPMSVGMGDLQDIEGVQTMHVVSVARTMELNQVVCRLSGPDGFDVLDMKVHGKPKGE